MPGADPDPTVRGELELTFTDTGRAPTPPWRDLPGHAQPAGWTPPVEENANELPWEQNPYFMPALEAVGITAVGADASKAYPNPPDDASSASGATYTGPTYAAGQTFVDGTAQVVPRHPINIYYNASTEAQEVDEYNTLYLPPVAPDGQCHDTAHDHVLDRAGDVPGHRQPGRLADVPEHADQQPRGRATCTRPTSWARRPYSAPPPVCNVPAGHRAGPAHDR